MRFRFLNLFVKNFRMGLATNSSSSHSLVYFREPRYEVGETTGELGWEEADAAPCVRTPGMDVEFGWGQFRLDTLYEKLMYALVYRIQRAGYANRWGAETDVETPYAEFRHLFPELTREDFTEAVSGYVDHQSAESDPDEVLEAARNPYVEIWGGNDNGGDPHEEYEVWDSEKGDYVIQNPPGGIAKVERL